MGTIININHQFIRAHVLGLTLLFCALSFAQAQEVASAFHFGLSGNRYSFKGIEADSLGAGTGTILGIELLHGINSWLDLSYNYSAGKTDRFEIAPDILSASQYAKFGVDLHFKLTKVKLLENIGLEPYLLTGYNLNTFKKIGDGDDFKVRTNTYGYGAGTSYRLNERFKLYYEISKRNNFDGNYTSNLSNRFGIAFKLYHPEKSLKKEPLYKIDAPIAFISNPYFTQENNLQQSLTDLGPDANLSLHGTIETPINAPKANWETTRILSVKDNRRKEVKADQDLREQFDGHYFVILGAYQNLNSATDLFNLVGQDVPFTSILETGLDFYRVGVATGKDSSVARNELSFFRIHGFPDAWLLLLEKPEYKIPTEVRPESSVTPREKAELQNAKGKDTKEPKELQLSSDTVQTITAIIDTSLTNQFEDSPVLSGDSTFNRSRAILKEEIRGYYIVMASFIDYDNAKKHKSQIGVIGENSQIIESEEGYFRVAQYIGGDVLTAEQKLLQFREMYKPDAWLLLVD